MQSAADVVNVDTFQRVCRSQAKVGMAQEDDESDTPEKIRFLGTVSNQDPWVTTILHKPVQFQIDSRAESFQPTRVPYL